MSLQGKNRKSKFLFDTSYKYAIKGSLIGLFMVVLTYALFFLSDQFLINFASFKSIHLNNPFIFIIDFLPILTAIGAFYISRNIQVEKKLIYEDLHSKNQLIERYTDS